MEEEFKVAFVIGHHREVKGSYSKFLKKYEYDFWKEYANSYLKDIGDVFEHEPGPIYKERQRLMANKTKEYDLVIELHFNGFNGESNGSEVLVYAGNEYTAKTGTLVSTMMASSMKYVNRGIKKLDNGNQNGYWFLRLMRGDAMLLEPFFGDVEDDCNKFNPEKFRNVIIFLVNYHRLLVDKRYD